MHQHRSGRLGGLLCLLSLLLTFALPAQAELVTTERVLDGADIRQQALVEGLQRDDVRAQLEALGVAPAQAAARVERLTDAEVTRLYRQVDALPAGGDISTVELLLIIILVILIV